MKQLQRKRRTASQLFWDFFFAIKFYGTGFIATKVNAKFALKMNIYSFVFCFLVHLSPQSMTLTLLLAKAVGIKKILCFVLIFV